MAEPSFVDEIVITLSSLDKIAETQSQLREIISRWGFVIIRGIVEARMVGACTTRLIAEFDDDRDQLSQPRVSIGDGNFQRFDNIVSGSVPRLSRTFFCFHWNEDFLGMRVAFETLSGIRNILAELTELLAPHLEKPLMFYDGPRIIQYPRGGGFISAHRDGPPSALRALAGPTLKNYTTLLVMTKLGRDFFSGGGWVCTPNGRRIYWEPFVNIGDVVVYDNSTLHGVDPVDEIESLRMDTINGRLVANCYFYPLTV